jgi:hypothetical protein
MAGEFFFATMAGAFDARLGAGSLAAGGGLVRGAGTSGVFGGTGNDGSGSNDTLMDSCGGDVKIVLGTANNMKAKTCRATDATKNRARGLLKSTTNLIVAICEKGGKRSFAFGMAPDILLQLEG